MAIICQTSTSSQRADSHSSYPAKYPLNFPILYSDILVLKISWISLARIFFFLFSMPPCCFINICNLALLLVHYSTLGPFLSPSKPTNNCKIRQAVKTQKILTDNTSRRRFSTQLQEKRREIRCAYNFYPSSLILEILMEFCFYKFVLEVASQIKDYQYMIVTQTLCKFQFGNTSISQRAAI